MKSKIRIKKENKGKFTDYCGGKVTEECIQKGKRSSDPAIRKRATFAANSRKWKHQAGGTVNWGSVAGNAATGIMSGISGIMQQKQLQKTQRNALNTLKSYQDAQKADIKAQYSKDAMNYGVEMAKLAADQNRAQGNGQRVSEIDANMNVQNYLNNSGMNQALNQVDRNFTQAEANVKDYFNQQKNENLNSTMGQIGQSGKNIWDEIQKGKSNNTDVKKPFKLDTSTNDQMLNSLKPQQSILNPNQVTLSDFQKFYKPNLNNPKPKLSLEQLFPNGNNDLQNYSNLFNFN